MLPDGTESLVNPLEVTVEVGADVAGRIALTTSATKPGLTYTLREGTMLDGMSDGASTPVWQDYVVGADPTNALSQFTAKIEMKDGASRGRGRRRSSRG